MMAVDKHNMVTLAILDVEEIQWFDEIMTESQFSDVLELLEDVVVHCAARKVTQLYAKISSSQHAVERSRGFGVLAYNSDDRSPSVLTRCVGGPQ